MSRHSSGFAFQGPLFKCGDSIEESELWPDDDYPAIPLLLEFAGRERVGRGHNRSSWIYVLWRYDPVERTWREVARTSSVGSEWVEHLRPIVLAEMNPRRAPAIDVATRVSGRVLYMLDSELDSLADEDRLLAMSLIYEQFTARIAALDRVA